MAAAVNPGGTGAVIVVLTGSKRDGAIELSIWLLCAVATENGSACWLLEVSEDAHAVEMVDS